MLIIVIMIMIIGFIGTFVPGLPGTVLIFLSTLVYGFVSKFEKISIAWVVVFGILTIISFVLDYVSSAITAKRFGATKYGIIGGILGAIGGMLILNIPGLFLGQFVGVLAGELYGGKALKSSAKAGVGGILGYLLGLTINISIGFFIICVFLFKTLK